MALSLVGPASLSFLNGGLIPETGAQWEAKPWSSAEISDASGLKTLAKKLNPAVGYWDPLEIGSKTKEEIAWFRHAEIKHGRVAMAAFVGYSIQACGLHFPGMLSTPFKTAAGQSMLSGVPTLSFADLSAAGGPADQWDALPTVSKVQILLGIGILELIGESSVALAADGKAHYMRGGTPGYYPSLKSTLNLWDPFGITKKMSAEKREKSLLAEINNGRLAMLGIMGLIAASKGCIVPGLDSLNLIPYAGEPMAPFSSIDTGLPFVTEMVNLPKFMI